MTRSAKRMPRLAAALLAIAAAPAWAAPEAPLLASVFQDHAVLQRDRPVAVFGSGKPGARVTLRLDGAVATARIAADGTWRTALPAHAAGGPYTLTAEASDGTRQTVSDILVGDVLLCSGQSNMEWAVAQSLDFERVGAQSLDGDLRLLKVARRIASTPQTVLPDGSRWVAAGPETVGSFSAACYFMGRELRKTKRVPIGLIAASWGGSTIQSWMSRAALQRFGGYDAQIGLVERQGRAPGTILADWTAMWERWWHDASVGRQGVPWRDPVTPDWLPVPAAGLWQTWGDRALEDYHGSLWFRTSVTLTTGQAAQGATLALGRIEEADHTWINGQALGTTEARGEERRYVIAPGALKAGSNDIVVHVFDGWSGGGMIAPADGQAIVFADGTRAELAQPWHYRRPPPGTEWSLRPPWAAMSGYSTITNGMLAPLTPYTIKAVAWYQGESNVADKAGYDKLLAAWMADWRTRFAQPDLPFLIVQLSAFGSPAANTPRADFWGGQRDLQRRAVLADPHAALVVTHDLGEPADIHPANKQEVGLRLARAASAAAYGEKISASGPRPLMARRAADAVTVSFADVEGALATYSARIAIGFELCSANGACRFAEGRISGSDQITIPLETDEAPATVRFCWADAPVCNLYDKAGLPPPTFQIALSKASE